MATGYRSWRMKYRFERREKLLTFGPYPDIGLKDARRMRDEARRVIRDGLDPSAVNRSAATEADGLRTFETTARDWRSRQSSIWTPTHAKDVLGSLVDHVFPMIGARR